jgi:hypothetical protein
LIAGRKFTLQEKSKIHSSSGDSSYSLDEEEQDLGQQAIELTEPKKKVFNILDLIAPRMSTPEVPGVPNRRKGIKKKLKIDPDKEKIMALLNPPVIRSPKDNR